MDPISLSQALMRTKSITPIEAGSLDVLENALKPMGFTCHRQTFEGVENLYARRGTSSPNLCFAGHVDVVPPGDIAAWKHDPFEPTIEGNVLYGRGASDMKTAIAAWVVAVSRCTTTQGSLSLLITCDEEGAATHGTKVMLEWLTKKGEKIDACIVGEPTNPNKLGEMIKIGRRGSVSFSLLVSGVQGHVAYPEKAANPITPLLGLLQELKSTSLDKGTKFFPPSNLEITSVDVGNPAGNVIPAKAEAKFNIRFNDTHTGATLVEWVQKLAKKHLKSITYNLQPSISAEAFFCPPKKLAPLVAEAVEKATGMRPEYSTTGGTSDARFIRHYCEELVECGLINETAHKVNESATLDDIHALTNIYEQVIKNYVAQI